MTMLRFRSITSWLIFLHVLAVATTAVVMPLLLFWMLNSETTTLHGLAMKDQAVRIGRYLSVAEDGAMSIKLPPSMRAQYSKDYGRYAYAVLDQDGHVLLSSRDSRGGGPYVMEEAYPLAA